MRQIDEAHDAENDREPGGVERIKPAEQDALQQRVDPAEHALTIRNRRREWRRASAPVGRPAEAHPPFLKTIGAIGDRHGVDEILLDQDHAGAARLDVGKRGIDVADDDRREAEAELVAEQDARVRHQAAADGDHLLLAAGQRRRSARGGAPAASEKADRRVSRFHGPSMRRP